MADDKELELDELDLPKESEASPDTPAPDETPAAPDETPAAPDASAAPGGDDGGDPSDTHAAGELDAVYDIPVQVQAVLGRTTMQVSQLLKLGRGAVVELDRRVGEAIDIYVNNRLIARGEVVVVDERLGVTMTEIIKVDHT